jgi:deoxyribodipyrimidine photo-lyase
MTRSIFILHRDLSIEDNIGLHQCIKESNEVFVIFIFTQQQADPEENKYFSHNSFAFLLGCLEELSKQIHIYLFYTHDPANNLKKLVKELGITSIWENQDFSPFAKQRQKAYQKAAEETGCRYVLCDSITLLPMGSFVKASGKKEIKAYLKFTPFYKHAITFKVPNPLTRPQINKISSKKLSGTISLNRFDDIKAQNLFVRPGRRAALKLLKDFEPRISTYSKERDFPILDSTSHLSAHLHFGTVSPREVYWVISTKAKASAKAFIQQLYWREFYMYIVNYVALSYVKKSWTMDKFNNIKWRKSTKDLKAWQEGKTGVPIVDAGMRQLLHTGYMHNRLRMVCAMYLIHFLDIHWKEGERWFARQLIDYSYANNYGGWVWCASIESHSNQYFRIFSMEQQHKRFDRNSEYVKFWCPELNLLNDKDMWGLYAGLDDVRKKRIAYLKTF